MQGERTTYSGSKNEGYRVKERHKYLYFSFLFINIFCSFIILFWRGIKLKKKEVIKHSSAIQVSNNVNLLQRRAWNILLAHAFDDLLKKDIHTITIKELCDYLQYDSKDEKYIKKSLKNLANTTVEWDLLNKNGNQDWGVASLLANVRIVNGICYYSYGGIFKEQLYNPKIYARINLSLQNKFKSKHTLALYELFIDYYRVKDRCGETPYIPLDIFKNLLGLKETDYRRFSDLNTCIIKKSIKEINAKSDLLVEVVYQRKERRVAALKFFIKENPAFTVKAIKEDYRKKKTKFEIEKEEDRKLQDQIKKEKALIEKLKIEFDEEYQQAINNILEKLSADKIKKLEKEFGKEIIKANKFIVQEYRNNGLKGGGVKIFFRAFIGEKFLSEEQKDLVTYVKKQKGYELIKNETGNYRIKNYE
jgi:hypothetical protein